MIHVNRSVFFYFYISDYLLILFSLSLPTNLGTCVMACILLLVFLFLVQSEANEVTT
ncbi:hypothetical protein F4809DRAFT_612716 [Biscogniauxia mediterranea]|nr:hypothetical protein F4809DRAFT_612716 [Biscogniauxia mediterranea]